MRRALVLATLLAVPGLLSGQATGVLRVTVMLPDAAQQATPIPRYALLISDNPASNVPKRVLTGPDGAVTIPLIPGSYTVESDRSAVFGGKAYEWTQMIDVVAGGAVALALTADNAEIVAMPAPSVSASADPSRTDPSFQADQWLGGVVAIWSPTSRATGFLFDARGLIATHGHVAATETTVAVQVSPDLKVPARVLFSDPTRDLAIVWVHPSVMAGRTPIPLGCPVSPAAALAEGQALTALTAPFGRATGAEPGDVTGFASRAVETDMRLGFGGAGGPVFNGAGALVGLTSLATGPGRSRSPDVTVVRAGILCETVAAAVPAVLAGTPPEPIGLPIEPAQRDPIGTNAKAASTGTPPVVSSSDFDVAVLTPALIQQALQNDRTGGRGARSPEAEARLGQLTDLGAWSDYVADLPPVVIVRVTPKMVEGFWKRLAREAARTQGANLPPFKDFTTSFVRMRASCGEKEIAPIQPFVLEHRASDTKVIREGLYVFDRRAFAPPCGRVTLSIYSEKAPDKADTVTIDTSVLGTQP